MAFGLFRKPPHASIIESLHGEIMAAARQPALYARFNAPDTFDGRFEMLALLATPPIRRLSALAAPAPEIAQGVTDLIFVRFDDALRQIGTSDVGVPKKIKKLAESWLGRRQVYAAALETRSIDDLAAAIARNAFAAALGADDARVVRLARYALQVDKAMAERSLADYIRNGAGIPPADETI